MGLLTDVFEEAVRQVEEQELDGDLLGEHDLRDVLIEVNKVVTGELMHIGDLSEDPEQNQEELRQLIINATVKTFVAGLLAGTGQAASGDPGIVLQIPAEAMEAIGLGIIRDGVVTFTLTTPFELEQPTD